VSRAASRLKDRGSVRIVTASSPPRSDDEDSAGFFEVVPDRHAGNASAATAHAANSRRKTRACPFKSCLWGQKAGRSKSSASQPTGAVLRANRRLLDAFVTTWPGFWPGRPMVLRSASAMLVQQLDAVQAFAGALRPPFGHTGSGVGLALITAPRGAVHADDRKRIRSGVRTSYRSQCFAGSCRGAAGRLAADDLQQDPRRATADDSNAGRVAARAARFSAGEPPSSRFLATKDRS
jgi:hypothetical protein